MRTGVVPSKASSGYSNADKLLSGNKLTLNANLTFSLGKYENDANAGYLIRTIGADMVINGGNIVTEYREDANKGVSGIGVVTSGNLYVNGGSVYAASYNSSNLTGAAYQVAGDVYVTGGTLKAYSEYQSGVRAANIYISGGKVETDTNYGGLVINNTTGTLSITGGVVEAYNRANGEYPLAYNDGAKSQAPKTPVMGAGVVITAGATADATAVVEDAASYNFKNHYIKVVYPAAEPGCDHTEVTVPGKTPTCTEVGYTEGKICTVCGERTVLRQEIPALGHTEEIIPGKEATATEPGLTEGKKCSVCGEILVAQEEIPATGTGECIEHTYTDDNDAVCNNCGFVRQMVDAFDFVNYRVVFSDSDTTHKNPRAVVYKLGDQTVADPSDEKALKAIDPTAETHWQAAYINKILITDAGNYVVLLKYNVGTSVVSVPMVLTVSADPKLIIDQNNKMTILDEDETHINHRVVVYYLAGESVEDIYDTEALAAIDAEPETHWQKTRINRLALTEGGTYVLHYQYNIGTSAAYTVAQSFTVESIPSLVVDVNNMFHASDKNASNTNHRVTIYNMGDAEVEDIFDETVVAAAAVSSETVWGLTSINDIEIKEAGNYIVHLYYNIASGHKRTLALDATLYERPVLSVTEDNKLLTSIQDTAVITSPRATYYYFGENSIDGIDIYDVNALKAAATTVSSTYWTQSTIHKVTLKDRGNYVVHLDYNAKVEGNSYKRTVAITTTVYDITKPTLTLGEGNVLAFASANIDATNYRATVYKLGDQSVEDIYDEAALKAIDSAAVTKWGAGEINKVQLADAGNYVVLVKYNLGTSTKTVAFQFTV